MTALNIAKIDVVGVDIGTVCNMADKLKVGMLVETNGNWVGIDPAGLRIRGHIVTMYDGSIYIGTNIDSRTGCRCFLKEAAKYGYSKTWQVAKSNNVAWIKILEDKTDKIELCNVYFVKDISDLLKAGMKVITNGHCAISYPYYITGIIKWVTPQNFLIVRTDTENEDDKQWIVELNNSDASIVILEMPEETKEIESSDLVNYIKTMDKFWETMIDRYSPHSTIKPTEENKMSLLYKFKQMFTTEPTKSLKKAGFIDDNGYLTQEGGMVFLKWLLDKNIDAFKAEVVDPLIKEMDKE